MFLTRATPTKYNPAAKCPTWLAHLQRLFVADWEIDFFQKALGAGLFGDSVEKAQNSLPLSARREMGRAPSCECWSVCSARTSRP